jgi:ParB/RepB/Spo0J family partition protein
MAEVSTAAAPKGKKSKGKAAPQAPGIAPADLNDRTATLSAELKVIHAIEQSDADEASCEEVAEQLGAELDTIIVLVGGLKGRGILRPTRTGTTRATQGIIWYAVAERDHRKRMLAAIERAPGPLAFERLAESAAVPYQVAEVLVEQLREQGTLDARIVGDDVLYVRKAAAPPAPRPSAQDRTPPLFPDVTPAPALADEQRRCADELSVVEQIELTGEAYASAVAEQWAGGSEQDVETICKRLVGRGVLRIAKQPSKGAGAKYQALPRPERILHALQKARGEVLLAGKIAGLAVVPEDDVPLVAGGLERQAKIEKHQLPGCPPGWSAKTGRKDKPEPAAPPAEESLTPEAVLDFLRAAKSPLSVDDIALGVGRSARVVGALLLGLIDEKQAHHVTPATKGPALFAPGPVPGASAAPGLQAWKTELVDESPFNHRKTFTGLDELAASLRSQGMHSPLVCRPSPSADERLELVCGHRRLRAAKLAGLVEVPVIVRAMTDEEAVEVQLVENGQRSDPHPLEEADGYQLLREKYGRSVAQIAAKVGKSERYVHGRLVLTSLGAEGREAFEKGELTVGGAVLLARATPEQQREAIKDLKPSWYDGDTITERQVREVLEDHVFLCLVDATFDVADGSLVPRAGTCLSCPKREGVQLALLAEAAGKDDLCTDKACFEAKTEAAWEKKRAEAEARGLEVLPAETAEKLFPHGSSLAWNAPFLDLGNETIDDEPADVDESAPPPATPSWRQRLGSALEKLPVKVCRDERGGVHELVPKAEAFQALKASGELEKLPPYVRRDLEEAASRGGETDASTAEERLKAEQAKEKEKQKVRRLGTRKMIEAVVEAAEGVEFTTDTLRAVVVETVRAAWHDVGVEICNRRGLDYKDEGASKTLVGLCSTLERGELRGLLVEILVTRGAYFSYRDGIGGEALQALGRVFEVEAPKVYEKAAEDELKAKKVSAKGKGEKKPASKASKKGGRRG